MTELAAAQAKPAPRRRSRQFPWGEYKVEQTARQRRACSFYCEPKLMQAWLGHTIKKPQDFSCGLLNFVGMTGFEPATTRPPDVYSNRAELHPEFRTEVIYLAFGTANVALFSAKQKLSAHFFYFFIFSSLLVPLLGTPFSLILHTFRFFFIGFFVHLHFLFTFAPLK